MIKPNSALKATFFRLPGTRPGETEDVGSPLVLAHARSAKRHRAEDHEGRHDDGAEIEGSGHSYLLRSGSMSGSTV